MKTLFLSLTIVCLCSVMNYKVKDADPTTPAQQTRYRGKWRGKTEQGLPIRFTVERDGRITNLELDLRIKSYPQECVNAFRAQEVALISDGKFEVAIEGYGKQDYMRDATSKPKVRGSFTSATECSGRFEGLKIGIFTCGGGLSIVMSGGDIETAWTAERDVICPTVDIVTPASGTVGTSVSITGKNLADVSALKLSDQTLANLTFISDTQITASVPAGAIPGTITLNQEGCPDVKAGAFTVLDSPVPSIASLKPASAKAGSPDLMITISGSNFINASIVKWNGSDRITTFVDSTQLTIQALATDLAEIGKVTVAVFNPAPGGGASNEVSFTINRKQPQAQTRSQGRKHVQRPMAIPRKP